MFSVIPYRTNNNMSTRSFFDDFDNSFFRPFFQEGFGGMLRTQPMKVDVREEDDHFVLEADMPGVKKENLKVEANDGLLTISASYNAETEAREDDRNYLFRERRTGSFSRSFNIDGIQEDGITARFENGVLTLNLPKKAPQAERETHAIEIQ